MSGSFATGTSPAAAVSAPLAALASREDFSRAQEHHRLGRVRQAERILLRLLEEDQLNAPALHLLGLISAEGGNAAAGAALIGRAIQIAGPAADWCVHLSTILEHLNNLPGATAALRQALEVMPADADIAFRLANLLTRCGHLEEAAERYRRAVELRPAFAESWFNLGVVLSMRSENGEAAHAYAKAIEYKDDYAEAHNNLGILLHADGYLELASECYEKAVDIRPSYLDARYNLGLSHQHQGRIEQAEEVYRQVIAQNSGHDDAHNNLGNVLLAQRRIDEARLSYQRSISISPDKAEAHWNLGVAELLAGNFRDGWREYEWRLRESRRYTSIPAWMGEPLSGRRILVWAEQGLGDSIQMIRFTAKLAEAGAHVVVECQRPLERLFENLAGVSEVVVRGAKIPPVDYQIAMMSLPGAFETDAAALPGPMPYLSADRALVGQWRYRLSDYAAPRIGLAWAGNSNHANDRNRSIDPAMFSRLAVQESAMGTTASFFTVQPDAQAPEGVYSLGEHIECFADTAALISELDLLITVDTAVAHLAGAMDRPVWTLLPHVPDWRWMLEGDGSPWYPSMRLYRQRSRGDWAGVFERVSTALRDTFNG